MGFVSNVLGGIADAISSVVGAVVDLAGDVIKGVGNAISGVVKFVGNTVEGILKDPLPILLQIGGAMVGIPPYVTAAVITAAKGGNLEDMAKSAAISYATTSFMSDTQIGADIKNYTSNAFAGDFTDAMMEKFNLPADTAVQIAKVATSSMNSALVGGINAALTGRPIADSIASGFTSGLVYASTDSYFNSLNKDPNWGFSSQALNLMKGATSTALNTIVSGKGDPSQALGNYIAYATINLGGTTLANAAKDAYKLLTTDTDAAKDAQDKYTTAKADYDGKVTAGEKLRNEVNADAAAYDKKITEEFNPFKTSYDVLLATNEEAVNTFNDQKKIFDDNKWAYDNYDAKMKGLGYEESDGTYYKRIGGRYEMRDDQDSGGQYRVYVADGSITDNDGYPTTSVAYDAPTQQSFADAANAAGTKANAAATTADSTSKEAKTLYDNNKTMLDSLGTDKTAIDKKVADLTVIRKDIEDVSVVGSTAATVKAAADAYQTKYDAWAKTKEAADRSATNYTKALAEVATRDATIDALNTGALKVTSKDEGGNWVLSNGMTVTTQGKFMQDGAQVFTNAAGIPQKIMDFKAADGSNVDFDDNAGRLLSETDVVNISKRDFGLTITSAEAQSIAGGTYNALGNDDITELANKKAREAYFSVVGKDPTATQLETIRKTGDVLNGAADLAINGLDLPADYVSPGASIQQKLSFGQAYAAARSASGNGAIFEWNGKKYTTENKQEQTARFDKYLTDAQNRINLMPASEVAGAGRGFVAGKPAGVENIYYGKKDDNVYVDTRTFDAMGNVTGGSLSLADDKTATNVRATNIVSQMIATGAQGFGELIQNYANGAALVSGSNMNNATYNLGKALEQWGKDRDGKDVVTQSKNMEGAIERAGKESNIFKQIEILTKAAKDNPLGMISAMGKEVVQEGPGWALGAVAAAGLLAVGGGVGAAALTAAGVAAALDGIESFGAGGREAYDALKKAGVPEDLAREKAIVNGAIHAAVTAPAEFLADKTLFKAYLSSVSGGVKEYAAKYGSTIATNAVSEFIEAVPQNLSTQYITTGKIDIKAATAGALYEGMIGGGTVTMVLGPAAINDAAIVAKDFAGNNVSLREFMDGTRNVNLSTLDSSATIGTSNNGGTVTLGALTAVGTDIGLSTAELKTFLPSSVTDYSSIVYRSADGTAVTLGNIDSIVKKNPSLDFTTVLDSVYTTSAADFKVVFSPNVLNGTVDLKPAIDYETTAKTAGFPSYAVYQQYGGDITLYNNAQNNNLATAAGFPDYGTYTQYSGDLTSYTTAKTNASNTQKAITAGFPDYASYTNFNGDKAAYDASKVVATTTGGTTTTGGATTGGATTGGATTGGTATGTTTGAATTGAATTGSTTGATTGAVTGGVTGTTTLTTAEANAKLATEAGFPDYATYTQYSGDIKAYNTAATNAANLQTATAAGFPDFASYTKFNGDIKAYNTEQTNATNLATAKAAGFPDYAAYTQYNGDVKAYNADSAAKIAGWKDAAEQTKASTAGYTDPSTYATYLTNTANTQKATTAGFPDYGTYTQFNGDLVAYNASKLTAETTKAINNAIAGIQFPAGITAADVAAQVKAALAANPGLSATDVTSAITTYMTANPGLSAADVSTAIGTVTKDLVSTKTFNTAIESLGTDVKTKFDSLSQGQKDIVKAYTQQGVDLNKAINDSAKLTADQITGVKTQLATLTGDVKTKFDALTKSQQDIVTSQVQLGVDLNKAIDDAAKTTTEQITNVKTDLTKNITDVQTQFNTRVDELVLQGKTYQEATQEALKELGSGVSGLQTSVTDIKKQQEAEAKAKKAADDKAKTQGGLSAAMAMIAPAAAAVSDDTPYRQIGLKTTGEAKFEGPLEQYLKMVREGDYSPNPTQQETQQQNQQVAQVQDELSTPQPQPQEGSDYFNYGQQTDINDLLGGGKAPELPFKVGGLATPLFAGGGTTRYGHYAGGGLNVVHHSGKPRLDFRTGNAVTGPGDGQSDDIPAMLADGEFVFPADVVAALGNGSTKAGSDKLYDMMHSIRAYHRSAKPKDLPPPAKKSPLDYLKKRTARR